MGLGGGGMFAGSVGNTGGLFPPDLAAAGTPSNMGKVGDTSTFSPSCTWLYPLKRPYLLALADVDPLGVNQNVTFDEVGGLDDRTSFIL